MLCFNCNGALGQFRDRPDLTLRAFAYLGHGFRTPVDHMPAFRFGVFHGDTGEPAPDQPPDDEPEAA